MVLGKPVRIEERRVPQSGEESSSYGHFTPVGRLQQSEMLLNPNGFSQHHLETWHSEIPIFICLYMYVYVLPV